MANDPVPVEEKPSAKLQFLNSFQLPKSTDLALWWIGTIACVALFMMQEPKDIVLAAVAGLVGYLGGKYTATSELK